MIENKVAVHYYQTTSGKIPYFEWFDGLDQRAQSIIAMRLARVRRGLFGDCSAIEQGSGICELRFFLSPGYRVYYGKIHSLIIMILCGGIKKTQKRDIVNAKRYWADYSKEGSL